MDRDYIINILLKARDDTAAAFAKATAEMKAFDTELDKQKAKNEESRIAQARYASELDKGTSSVQRYKKALADLGLELDDKKKKTEDQDRSARRAIEAYIQLEAATKKVTKAQVEGKEGTAQYAKAVGDLRIANLEMQRALRDATSLNQQQAQVRAHQISQEFEYQARLAETAKVAEKQAKERIASEREVQRTVDALNREAERSRIESMRRLAQADAKDARDRAARRKQDAADIAADAKARAQKEAEFQKITQGAYRPAGVLARTDVSQRAEIQATKELAAARALLIQRGHDAIAVDTAMHHIRQDALHDMGHASQAARDEVRLGEAQARAYEMVATAAKKVEAARRTATRTNQPVHIDPLTHLLGTPGRGGHAAGVTQSTISQTSTGASFGNAGQNNTLTAVIGGVQDAQKKFGALNETVISFGGTLKNAMGVGAILAIQPLIALIVGLVAAFASIASAAVAAATAIGVTFAAGIAQAIPSIGLFAAAMQRLQSVFQLVTILQGQAQQKFTSQFEAAQQAAMGINQIVIAQHNYRDALYGAQQAIIGVTAAEHARGDALFSLKNAQIAVGVAELGLRTVRQQAIRQLQDLVTQETNARLAAEQSSKSVTDAQKALRAAIATGGDVTQAQMDLAQAQASHHQAVTQAQRSIADAAPGSIARQNIQQQVVQGQQAVQQANHAVADATFAYSQAVQSVTTAQRAVVDAQFQVAQAKAAIAQAKLAAQGYNLATAAQLAWLRATMSSTEQALAGNIRRILGLFESLPGHIAKYRGITDAILGAFVPLTARIYAILNDPRVYASLLNLAKSIGGFIKTISNALTSPEAVKQWIGIVNSAAQNMAPLAKIAVDLFKGFGSIIQVSLPYVHQFLGFISGLTGEFSKWAQSKSGQNWLKQFFDEAFKSAEAFIGLGLSLIKLIAAVVGVGGGAKSGIGILQELQKWMDSTANSINHHGKVFKELHQLWSIAIPTVKALGSILGVVGNAFLKLATSKQGQDAFKGFVDIITHVIIPAFVQFITIIGHAAVVIGNFVRKHPELAKTLATVAAVAAALTVAGKALGIITGPIGAVIGIIVKLGQFIGAIKTLIGLFGDLELAEIAAFLGPLAPIAAVVAAIIAIAVLTGNLGNLFKTIAAPFIAIWNQIKGPLDNLGKQFLYFINGILSPFGVHVHSLGQLFHDVFAGILSVVKTILTEIGNIVGGLFGNAFKIIGDFFKLLGDLVRGHFGAVLNDFKKLGLDIIKGLWDALSALPRLILRLFIDLVDAILKFLGISSPSKKFHSIGQAMIDGLWNALKSIGQFAGKIIAWIGTGISNLIRWVENLGGNIIKALWNGIKKLATSYFNFEKWLWKTIFDAIWGLLGDIEKLGEKIIDAIIKGIKKAPGKIASALSSLIPKPIKDAANAVGSLLPWNWNKGGAVPGYGGGDIVASRLEPGEHVFTKEEVSAAGGHGAIFALRQSLGGGGQGGPGGYAQGGAVGGTPGGAAFGGGPLAARTTQGVTGQLGGQLYNVLQFIKEFIADWANLWVNIDALTSTNTKDIEKLFTDFFSNLNKQLNNFATSFGDSFKKFWSDTNNSATDNLGKFKRNFDDAYTKIDKDTYNALWYILNAANKSLKAFGAKPTDVKLGAQPAFAVGGFIGNMGERGRDAVHALLGRGEAVLNYAHQAIVEPAMNAFYGFGLNKMFQRTGGEHSSDGMGYAGGGYVFPFGKSGWSWSRTDQGVDFGGNAPVGAIGPATVTYSNPNDGWYPPAPAFMVYRLDGGPDSGKYVYVAEHISGMAPAGTQVKAGQAIAQMTGGIEMGWAAGPHGYQIVQPLGPNHLTAAGEDFHKFLIGLTHGQITGGNFGAVGASAAQWSQIKEQAVHGTGALATLLKKIVSKTTDAANTFGGQQAGTSGGGGQVGANWSGPWVSVMAQIAKKFGWNLPDWKWLVNAESSGKPSIVNPSSGAFGLGQFLGATAQAYAKFGALSRSPVKQIEAMAQYIMDRYKNPTVAKAFHLAHNWYKEGGFVDGAIPILAHAGEWVLNKAQQSKLGGWIGAAPSAIANALGFSGKPQTFADGGIVRAATGLPPAFESFNNIGAPLLRAIVDLTNALKPLGKFGPGASSSGVYDPGQVSQLTPGFQITSATVYNRAQATTLTKLSGTTKKINDGINQFLNNWNQISGDNGPFALAEQALQNLLNRQQSATSLLAAGIKIVNNKFNKIKPETAVEAAQHDLANTVSNIQTESALRAQQVIALGAINKEISRITKEGITKSNVDQYNKLLGARQSMVNTLDQTDQDLASAYSDKYTKAVALFQAQNEQALRGTGTISGADFAGALTNLRGVMAKVGPNIASGLAQMAQQIAQTYGRTQDLLGSSGIDQSVIDSAKAIQSTLQDQYAAAATKAKNDPRWQSVADDLLSQLESATENVAQALAQQLTDAISSQDTQTQLQQAANQSAVAIAQAAGQFAGALGSPAGQFGAISTQIGLSQSNQSAIAGQIANYTNLLGQAQTQGNQGAINTLTQTLDQLNSTMEQANLQTQQLITSYYQLSTTLQNTFAQTSQGFIGSAQGILQTIGQITGSMNLPALIASARAATQTIADAGSRAVGNINNVVQGGAGAAFGAASGTANTLLGAATGAFQQGPQAFAQWLAANAGSLANFEAGLPQDEQTLFQSLIQSLIDNTTAQVNNTQQLQQLNATTNQQPFSSSAWTMFRQAIFTGLGGLLPQYAMQVPSLDVGGTLMSSGLLYGHAGETITPADVVRRGVSGGNTYNENHFNLTHPVEVADPVIFGNDVAWRLSHNPNSR